MIDQAIIEKLKNEIYTDGYYHVREDIEKHPRCWAYIVWSRRGPGKTYGALRYCLAERLNFMYIRRTNKEVKALCAKNNKKRLKQEQEEDEAIAYEKNKDPFVPINRDFGTTISARLIEEGEANFYETNEEGNAFGFPVGICYSLNRILDVKGADFSDIDIVIIDEFIPQIGQIIRRGDVEGEQFLELLQTIRRDRIRRGRPPLKCLMFANAENISVPLTRVLEIVDNMADMNANQYDELEDRYMFLHHLTSDKYPFTEEEKDDPFYLSMKDTKWGRKSFEGEFTNNDFSNICNMSIKKSKCYCRLKYKQKYIYIYVNNQGVFYATDSKSTYYDFDYNLDTENGQKMYYFEQYADMRYECAEGRFKFKKYSYYDLIIVNFTNIFNF